MVTIVPLAAASHSHLVTVFPSSVANRGHPVGEEASMELTTVIDLVLYSATITEPRRAPLCRPRTAAVASHMRPVSPPNHQHAPQMGRDGAHGRDNTEEGWVADERAPPKGI